jgi:hypothetical protein
MLSLVFLWRSGESVCGLCTCFAFAYEFVLVRRLVQMCRVDVCVLPYDVCLLSSLFVAWLRSLNEFTVRSCNDVFCDALSQVLCFSILL